MSVRVNASGEYLRRTANLPSSTAFTMCGWVRLTKRASAFQYWGIENATSNSTAYLLIGYNNSGVFEISSSGSGGGGTFASAPTDEKWLFWAITNQGTGASDFKGYWRHFDDTSWKTTTGRGVSMTPAMIQLGNDSFDEWCNAGFANTLIINAALTQAQLETVMNFSFPAILENVNIWSPHVVTTGSTERLKDFSGNGRDWTAGGTLSDEDDPPLIWDGYMDVGTVPGIFTIAVNQVSETDQAQIITRSAHIITANQVSETDTAQAITRQKIRSVGQVTETDTAQPITLIGANIFVATHDAGNLSEYTATDTGGGDNIVVNTTAALVGPYGMQVMVDDANPHYGAWAPAALDTSNVFACRIYIKRGSLSLSDLGQVSFVFFIINGGTQVFGSAKIINISGTYYLRGVLIDDSDTHHETVTFALDTNKHFIELRYTKATSNVASDAKLEWWVDGSPQTTISGFDLYDHFNLQTLAVGAVGQAGTVSGNYYLDQVVLNHTGAYIGAAPMPVAQVTETDTAQPIKWQIRRLVNQISETDLAQTITRIKRRTLGQPAETDTAQPITSRMIRLVNQISETDAAQAITRRKIRSVGQVSETDTAQPVTRINFHAVAQVTETDAAQPIARIKLHAMVQAAETDVAQPITRQSNNHIVPINQVTEADSAQAISSRKIKTVAQATETDSSQAVVHRKLKAVGQVTEADLAQGITRNTPGLVNQAFETDLAQLVVHQKRKAVAQVTETDLALALVRVKRVTVTQVAETDLAQALFPRKQVHVVQVQEVDLALAIKRVQLRTVAQATEIDLAQSLAHRKLRALGQAVETDVALVMTALGGIFRIIAVSSVVIETVSVISTGHSDSFAVNSVLRDVLAVNSEDEP